MEGAGVVTHFQDSPEHPGLSETVPALPAGHLGKRGGARKGKSKREKVRSASAALKPNSQENQHANSSGSRTCWKVHGLNISIKLKLK